MADNDRFVNGKWKVFFVTQRRCCQKWPVARKDSRLGNRDEKPWSLGSARASHLLERQVLVACVNPDRIAAFEAPLQQFQAQWIEQ